MRLSLLSFQAFSKTLFLAAILCIGSFPLVLSADTVSISPSSGSYSVGSTFTVRVLASSPSRSINALSGSVSFPADKLQVVSISKADSIINLWVQDPTFSNISGSFNFEGVVLNPGYMGSGGKIVSVTFRAIASGQAQIGFVTASMLANDGTGSNVLRTMQDAHITITGGITQASDPESPLAPKSPVITSSTHPNQDAWYSASSAEFSWKMPLDVTAVRLLYDENPLSEPSVLYNQPLTSKTITGLSDGQHYFHVQFKNGYGWGEVAHYSVKVDTIPPVSFKITFPHGNITSTPQPIIFFNTTDSMAGIDRYIVKVGEKVPIRVGPAVDSNPYVLPEQVPGKHTVLVEAYDKAGNYSTASAEFDVQSIEAPEITVYPQELEYDDLMKIRGITYPNATVNMYIREGEKLYYTDFTKSNNLGDFGIVVTKRLEPGAYTFTVDVIDAAGAKSLETNPISFEVKSNPIIKLAGSVTLYTGLAVILLAVISGLAFLFYHAYGSILRMRKNLQKDVDQMGKGIHKAFDLLRDDVSDHVRILERAKSKRDLSKEEEKILVSLHESLDEAENFLAEKLDGVKKDIR